MPLTSGQFKAALDLQRILVETGGMHPVRAGILIRGAVNRLEEDAGLGKVHQTRRVRHELPGVPARVVIRGET